MAEPAYVSIAGEYARLIRGGSLLPDAQLPSYAELAERHKVSDIVIRKAIELLLNQGLVRSVRRRGVFVSRRPHLVRVSPERQMEDPEQTFSHESSNDVHIEREIVEAAADEETAGLLDTSIGASVTRTVTRASEGGQPISISDTYQPLGITGISDATVLEETLTDKLPTLAHAQWLRVTSGDLVKAVRQRFFAADGRVIMVSDVSYPRDRYESFVFRMSLAHE